MVACGLVPTEHQDICNYYDYGGPSEAHLHIRSVPNIMIYIVINIQARLKISHCPTAWGK